MADPGEARRRPSLTSPTYAVRAPLAAWLRAEADVAARREPRPRLLDVGCGTKPYAPFFAGNVAEYVGVDVSNPEAELEGTVEEIPVPDGTFDLVLCTQTLEHANDPARAVHELRRVVAPGGRVLASTHGVQVYHPNPDDLWRWTHAGLERLFRENGAWSDVLVAPSSGTTACLGMLVATYLDLLAKRARVRPLGSPVIAAVNAVARGVDRALPPLSTPQPGTIFANYHVTATP
ncbi:MAG: class I SAM-dependent methyltransferase [Actinobacteria bacterium]|nr:MAG: class I SAM-dependent methyltransferase [Actinomycetota bacterium]